MVNGVYGEYGAREDLGCEDVGIYGGAFIRVVMLETVDEGL